MWTLLSLAAVAAVAFLSRSLVRRFGADRIEALTEKRRAGSLVVSRGALIDGNRHVPVAMALTKRTLFYENRDLEGSLELEWVTEVEYDSRAGTGSTVVYGEVLRLRCYSQCFEFLLSGEAAARWQAVLPAGRGTIPADETNAPLQVAAAV